MDPIAPLTVHALPRAARRESGWAGEARSGRPRALLSARGRLAEAEVRGQRRRRQRWLLAGGGDSLPPSLRRRLGTVLDLRHRQRPDPAAVLGRGPRLAPTLGTAGDEEAPVVTAGREVPLTPSGSAAGTGPETGSKTRLEPGLAARLRAPEQRGPPRNGGSWVVWTGNS